MADKIDFYFDFSSPYGYLASERIEALAARHDLQIDWHAILLGFIFPVTGQKPLVDIPLINSYSEHDMQRAAREHAIAFQWPGEFPVSSVAACRAFYWLKSNQPGSLTGFIHAIYRAYFTEDKPITRPADVLAVAAEAGLPADELTAAFDDPQIKAETRKAVEQAIEKGVFGSPFFIVDGEPFWGNDRLDQLDRWLQKGGW
ncbi:MAG: 2-hydroxychromene-2-carboxylate isomerase [Gammaproteobacteria bacterium]|nr:2-hydroxychromene-2-carboxylate isomerase [Gammaproteobacteria bacterium]